MVMGMEHSLALSGITFEQALSHPSRKDPSMWRGKSKHT